MGLVFTIFTLVIESYPILIIKHSNTIKKKKQGWKHCITIHSGLV
jgi:hypothetical protein